MSGVNVLMTTVLVFALAGAMYGWTGFVEGARVGSNTANTGLKLRAGRHRRLRHRRRLLRGRHRQDPRHRDRRAAAPADLRGPEHGQRQPGPGSIWSRAASSCSPAPWICASIWSRNNRTGLLIGRAVTSGAPLCRRRTAVCWKMERDMYNGRESGHGKRSAPPARETASLTPEKPAGLDSGRRRERTAWSVIGCCWWTTRRRSGPGSAGRSTGTAWALPGGGGGQRRGGPGAGRAGPPGCGGSPTSKCPSWTDWSCAGV